MNKTNTKQVASNADRMNRKIKLLEKEIFIVTTDSKAQNDVLKDQFLGGIIEAVCSKVTSLIDA